MKSKQPAHTQTHKKKKERSNKEKTKKKVIYRSKPEWRI